MKLIFSNSKRLFAFLLRGEAIKWHILSLEADVAGSVLTEMVVVVVGLL